MSKELTTKGAFNKDFKQVYVGEEPSNIFINSEGKVKVSNIESLDKVSANNDLIRIGSAVIAGATYNAAIVSDDDLTIKSDGKITFMPEGQVVFKETGTVGEVVIDGGNSRVTLYPEDSFLAPDYAKFETDTNGALTITTVDGASANADFIVDADGDITLDSSTGVFVAKNNGTEFSAANSAYAGMILGYTCIANDSADDSYAVGASYAVIDALANITFVAPPSGNVEIFVSVYAKSTATRQLYFGLSDNATYNTVDVTHEHEVWIGDETDEETLNHQWVVTGLTAGTSYTYFLGANSAQSGRISLHWGGDATGEYAPLIMKATALPATLYTG